MKWGRKKASSASSHPSLIAHVFPSSWFSKFKQKRSSFQPKSAKAKHKVQQALPSSCSLSNVPWKEGRFYCGDDEPYWRLSFGEEGAERSKVWLNSVWDEPNDDEHEVAIPNSGGSKSEAVWMFNNMVSDACKANEMQDKVGSHLKRLFTRERVSASQELQSQDISAAFLSRSPTCCRLRFSFVFCLSDNCLALG